MKEFADENFKFDENGRRLSKQKTMWEKEKLLVTSHSVFKRLVSQRRQKVLLCGNGLKDIYNQIVSQTNELNFSGKEDPQVILIFFIYILT